MYTGNNKRKHIYIYINMETTEIPTDIVHIRHVFANILSVQKNRQEQS